MKKNIFAAFLLLIVLLTAGAAFADDGGGDTKFSEGYEKLIPSRLSKCYVEGEMLGDMLLNARGEIDFVYIDRELSESLSKSFSAPAWLADCNNHYYGSASGEGRAVFAVKLVAYKPWQIDIKQFTFGGYNCQASDSLVSSDSSPFGKNARDEESWSFVLTVPKKAIKPGSEMKIGYGKYLVKWKVPK